MEYSYKFRLYPNREQENLILRTLGCCRYVYNRFLAERKELYEQESKTLNYVGCAKKLTELKQQEETSWLREVDSTALQSSLKDLDTAYQNFFRGIKNGAKQGYPAFKSKHNRHQSYKSKCVGATIKVFDGAIQLPKLGTVKCRTSRQVQGRILSATVSRTPSNKYYVALCCTEVEIQPLPSVDKAVGIDLGLKVFAISSDGKEYPNNKYLSKNLKKLARLQRSLSRKTKGSNNREKARVKVARLHEHISNQRLDGLHKLSTELVRQNDIICMEELAPSNMVRNRKLARNIEDASWSEFKRLLTYKAEWYGRKIITVDRFYPSSQLCSCCGHQWSGTKDLKVRRWKCPDCGAEHDRDLNAAKNILNEGLRLLG